MKYMYSVSNVDELNLYSEFVNRNKNKIDNYIKYLIEKLRVEDVPEFVVLSNLEMATKVHKKIDLPAYTNDIRVVFNPELDVWKNIYLKQFDVYKDEDIVNKGRDYYSNLNEHHILQILGHELTHQSELFLDDFDDNIESPIWFEEGMVEYISKKYFLTTQEYERERKFNQYLVDIFENKYGVNTIENFNYDVYDESITVIFYYYWKSFLLVDSLVEKFPSLEDIFTSYHRWDDLGRNVPLSTWFELE